MRCKIEKLIAGKEEALIIKIPLKAVTDFIVLFAALHLEKIQSIHLGDKASDCFVNIQRDIAKKVPEYVIRINDETFPIRRTSLEAIASLMTDVAINGWSDVAHIDIELNEYISVCFYVESPSQDISDFIK